MDRIKKVSFVIPCYRSEHTLPHVVTEIREKMQELTQYTYDIFLVNDASPDNTMETIRDNVTTDFHVFIGIIVDGKSASFQTYLAGPGL